MILAFYRLLNIDKPFLLKNFYMPVQAFFLSAVIPFNKKAVAGRRHRLRFPSFLIILISFLCSCGAQSSKKNMATGGGTDTSLLELPKPVPIAPAEAMRLRNACQRWFDTALLPKGFNGGIIVAKNGNVVFEKYTGTIHIPGADVITATTPMHIASVSKTFTAMAVLKMWQEGKLNIDDDLSKYIPQFNYAGVTIRSLLNHRSGLPNYTHFLENMGWDKNRLVSNQDVLDFMVNNKSTMENVAPANSRFSYSNTNYALLALLVEKISGEKFVDFMKQTFFIPLQMKHTFIYQQQDSGKVTPSYDWKGRPMAFSFLDAVYGDKNIYTTPQDLLIWDRALTSGKIFKPEILEQAYTPYSNEKPGVRNYGLGWRMNIYPDGKKMIYHNGWWHGSNACFIRLLKEGATIIVIGNKFTRGVYGAKILCDLFGDYYTSEEDEENSDNTKTADTINTLSLPSTNSKPLSKKDQQLQQLFKDKNKVSNH